MIRAGVQTLCDGCANAVPGLHHGCPWSREFKPVPGWVAEHTPLQCLHTVNGQSYYHTTDSYIVHDCPQFVPDAQRETPRGMDMEAMSQLCIAVIGQAAEDYRELLRQDRYYRRPDPLRKAAMQRLEKFFLDSPLCLGQGEAIIRGLKAGR